MTSATKAHIGLLLANLFFALNYSAIKHFTMGKIIGPFGLNILRVGVCMMIFWALYIFNPNKQNFKKKDMWRLVMCAIAAIALNQMLFIKGLSYTSPLHASLLTFISPVLITVSATLFLKEKFTYLKGLGLLLAFLGTILLLQGKESFAGDNFLLGDSLIIGSAIAYTAYFIMVKPLMSDYSPFMVTRMIFTIGFFLTLPFCIKEVEAISFSSFSFNEWMILAFIIIPGTFFAYFFNIYGIKILNASKAGVYIYTQPFFAGIAAVIFLNEKITLYKIVAAALIFSGLYLAQRRQKNISGIRLKK